MRLNRFIAGCTSNSRRQADQLIKQGKISINGQLMTDLSYQVKLADKISLAGMKLTPFRKVYYALNKPVGYVTSRQDRHSDRLVVDLVPKVVPVFPVGRLDKDSRGLLLLTNDGDWANQLTHPSHQHEKEYLVTVNKNIRQSDSDLLIQGIRLTEGKAKFDCIKQIKPNVFQVIIHQGWNRQIRRMFGKLGYEVVDLLRIRIAGIELGGLPEGKYVEINPRKLDKLIKK